VGELAEAEALYRRSLAIREEIYEGDHFEVARGLRPLGALLVKRGEVEEALALLERAEAIFAEDPGRVPADLELTRADLARARAAAAS
jgi:tetratricopeptide (TPR) repeat protein